MFFDNTGNIKRLAKKGIPPIPQGAESFKHEIGSTATCTASAVYKEGTKVTIEDRYMQHGYAYYRDTSGRVHRNKDLS